MHTGEQLKVSTRTMTKRQHHEPSARGAFPARTVPYASTPRPRTGSGHVSETAPHRTPIMPASRVRKQLDRTPKSGDPVATVTAGSSRQLGVRKETPRPD